MSYRIAIAGRRDRRHAAGRRGPRGRPVRAFAASSPLGSGLVIPPVGLAVPDRIGAGEEARRLSSPIARMHRHEVRGLQVLDVSYPATAPGRGIHRAGMCASTRR